jgi:hypothetical protein
MLMIENRSNAKLELHTRGLERVLEMQPGINHVHDVEFWNRWSDAYAGTLLASHFHVVPPHIKAAE